MSVLRRLSRIWPFVRPYRWRLSGGIVAFGISRLLEALVPLFLAMGIDRLMGLRAPTLNEQRGLDYTEHHEIGYPEFQDSPGGMSKEA